MNSPRRAGGFTLIEVLLATFVIALGVLGILALFAGAAKQQQASSYETASIFATRNAEGVLTSNFSALGVDPGAPLPRVDVWNILPMNDRFRYLTAPSGMYFLVSVTQPLTLYERPPSGLTFEMPNEQQPYRFGSTLEPPLQSPFVEPAAFDPDGATMEFPDFPLDPDSIRMRVTFSRVVDPDGDGEYERENFQKFFSRTPGAGYTSDIAAEGTKIWTVPMDGDICNDSVVQQPGPGNPFVPCSSDPALDHDASYITIYEGTEANPARIDAFHFEDIAANGGVGLAESVRVEKIEVLEYKWRNDQLVSLGDRITTRVDASSPSNPERPDQCYSVLFKRTATGAQAAVVTYQLTATSSGTEYVPPERPGDIQGGRSPLRVGILSLYYDAELDQYYFRATDETMLWAIVPGQVLFVQGSPVGPASPGSDGPVRVVRFVRESALQGTPLWRGYLDRQPRAHDQGMLPWQDAQAGLSVQLRVIGVRESVTSLQDESVWKLTPLRGAVFPVNLQ